MKGNQKRFLFIFLLCGFFALCLFPSSVRAEKAVTARTVTKQCGKCYHIVKVKSIKNAKQKVTMKVKLSSGRKVLKLKKRTYKIAKRVKILELNNTDAKGDWWDCGTVSRKEFIKILKADCKEYMKTGFPVIEFWVKSGVIKAYNAGA